MRLDKNKLIRLKEVMAITGLCRSAIYSNMKGGHFPLSVSIGTSSVAWVEAEVREWVDSRIEERNRRMQLEGYR
ncbi:helix-turn-helix transcriptional regulator [Vibrio sp. DNB22_19_2]